MADIRLDKRALERVADEALRKRGAELQRVFDGVHRDHAGMPVDDV